MGRRRGVLFGRSPRSFPEQGIDEVVNRRLHIVILLGRRDKPTVKAIGCGHVGEAGSQGKALGAAGQQVALCPGKKNTSAGLMRP